MFSAFNLHLYTLGAVGSRLCSAQGAVVDFLPEPGFEPTTLGYLGFQVQRSIHQANDCPVQDVRDSPLKPVQTGLVLD